MKIAHGFVPIVLGSLLKSSWIAEMTIAMERNIEQDRQQQM